MAASGASAALRFLALPLLAALMSAEEFGRASLFLATLPFLSLAISWNLAVPWVIDYHGKTDVDNRRLMGGAMAVVAGSGAVLGALAWLLHPWIEPLMDFGVGRAGYLQMVACAVLSSISLLHLELDKIRQETGRYLVSSLAQTLLQLGAALGWILVDGPDFRAFLSGHAAGCLLLVAFQSLARRGAQSPLLPRPADTFRLWIRALPIALSSTFALVASLADRQFVRAATSYADVAYYTMGAKIGEIVQQIVLVPALAAMTPALLAFAHRDPESLEDGFRLEMRRFAALAMLATTSLAAALDPLYALLLPPSYAPGIPVSLLFLCAFALGGIGQAWASTILARGRLHAMMRLTATAALASLALNALLTPRFHMLGAAVAAICVQGISCLQSWIAAGRIRHCLDHDTRTLVAASLLLPGLQLGAAWIAPSAAWSIGLRAALWLVALALAWSTGFLQELAAQVRNRILLTLGKRGKSP